MTNPTEAPTAGMEAWVRANSVAELEYDDGLIAKAREIDATIRIATIDKFLLKDALAESEKRACGLAEAATAYVEFHEAADGFYDTTDMDEVGAQAATDLHILLRAALKTDARCTHAARVETLEKALRSIADNKCCDGCQEAARVAASALRSGTGSGDGVESKA